MPSDDITDILSLSQATIADQADSWTIIQQEGASEYEKASGLDLAGRLLDTASKEQPMQVFFNGAWRRVTAKYVTATGPNNGNVTLAHGLTIANVRIMDIMAVLASTTATPDYVPLPHVKSYVGDTDVGINVDSANMNVYSSGNWSNHTIYAWIFHHPRS